MNFGDLAVEVHSAEPADFLVPLVNIRRWNSDILLDPVAQAAMVAAAEVGAVVDLVEEATAVLAANRVATAEVGSVEYSIEALAFATGASQQATGHQFTLALSAPGCTELAEACRADLVYWARQKALGPQPKVDDQHLAQQVVTEV